MKEHSPQFKGSITFTRREVPAFLGFFQKFGFFLKAGKIVSIKKYNNIFVNSGKQSILDRFTGLSTGLITYLALGSGTNVPLASDTTLQTETYRKVITSRTRSGLKFYSSTFIPSTEGDGTYKEIGLFGDSATASANSGTLFTRAAVDEVKNSGESVTIDYDLESN